MNLEFSWQKHYLYILCWDHYSDKLFHLFKKKLRMLWKEFLTPAVRHPVMWDSNHGWRGTNAHQVSQKLTLHVNSIYFIAHEILSSMITKYFYMIILVARIIISDYLTNFLSSRVHALVLSFFNDLTFRLDKGHLLT